jgi:hypothetical protein
MDAFRKIAVDRDSLIAFLEFRSKRAGDEPAETRFESMPAAELQRLIEQYVLEEALYREAKQLGLDQQDYANRRRLIGQLRFINKGVVAPSIKLTDDDLRTFLSRNADRYRIPEMITFTHVFYSSDRHGEERARALAVAELMELNGCSGADAVPFHKAVGRGDRFPYQKNYVRKDPGEVASHFGGEFHKIVFELVPDATAWRGPYRSDYGYHLVLVSEVTESIIPEFEEIRDRIEVEAYESMLEQTLDQFEQSVAAGYTIKLDDRLAKRVETVPTDSVEDAE